MKHVRSICIRLIGCTLAVSACGGATARTTVLQRELAAVAARCRAEVGIAAIIDHADTVLVNNGAEYPLMSVFKLHQTLFVLDRLQAGGRSLDEPIRIRRRELLPDTHSPLRDRFPEGDVTLPVRELLRYTMQQSDNNACDVLFRRFGGPRAVERYWRRRGLRTLRIRHNEARMHRNPACCYANRTSPLEAVRLLEQLLSDARNPQLTELFALMERCETGRDRLAAPLFGTQAVIGHKTGTGDRNAAGCLIGVNDIGYVRLPNGRVYTIAVFVKDAEGSIEEAAAVIAEISARIFRYAGALPALSAEP